MTSPDFAHHFSDRNVPFGIASSTTHPGPQAVTRLGNSIIFLDDCLTNGLFEGIEGLPKDAFSKDTLNNFAALPRLVQSSVREVIQKTYRKGGDVSNFPSTSVEDVVKVQMHLPVSVGDFADFSCSLTHVINAGRIVTNDPRPPPAFYNFPTAYQGRASSIVVSGTDIERPMGQFWDKTSAREPKPVLFGPSRAVDYEMEFAAIIGKPLPMRLRLKATDAHEHIFGFVILNDWSARDIQGFEMKPLGPFNGKSLGTSISPWVVTLDALDAFRTTGPQPVAEVNVPPHLQDAENRTYSVRMQVEILAGDKATVAGTSKVQDMYWNPRQMVAHAASAGTALRTGDIMATGTVSGAGDDERGCMLELTDGGSKPFKLDDGTERRFLQDGDVVRMTAVAGDEESGVGFGECIGKLVQSGPY